MTSVGEAMSFLNSPVNPDDLINENCYNLLWNKLAGLQSAEEKVDLLLRFCKPYIKERSVTAGFSSAKFEKAFDFTPTSYEEGVKTTAEWFLYSSYNIK